MKYTLGIFLVYPFAALLPSVPTVTGKHLYSMIMGVALMQWIYGPDWIHSFISSFVTYLICIILPKKYIAKIAFFWVMGYMVGE
jgi:undecaprenyl pyrophosphate phosphatase UppP